eukprot:12542860-Prorocentrum_lima.AAC.1
MTLLYSGSAGDHLGHPTVTISFTKAKLESGFHFSADCEDALQIRHVIPGNFHAQLDPILD